MESYVHGTERGHKKQRNAKAVTHLDSSQWLSMESYVHGMVERAFYETPWLADCGVPESEPVR